MQATVDGFGYGAVTPVAAFLVASLGGGIGLRCTVRARQLDSGRPKWLAYSALSLGVGIWTMHFIAMMGFQVHGAHLDYDARLTFLSLAVAVLVVGVGVFAAGYGGRRTPVLLGAGLFMGLGVAAMHYMGMAAMRFSGTLHYSAPIVAASVGVAVVAATAALWLIMNVRGFLVSLGASLLMGVAVCAMHYLGMEALTVELMAASGNTGSAVFTVLVPYLIGPFLVLFFAGAVLLFDPQTLEGDPVARS
ncbi:MHYT domain-containing protein [Streptomyces sp. NPDC001661]